MRNSRAAWMVGLGLVAAALLAYAPALAIARYGDDLGFLLPNPGVRPFFHFTAPHPHHFWYRPIESSWLLLVQAACGLVTWPIHLLHILLHAALACLVWQVVLELGFSRWQAAVGAALLLVHQVAVIAVASNDTLSQVLASTAGSFSLWLFRRGSLGRRREYGLALLALAVALWSKEAAIGFLPALALLTLVGPSRERRSGMVALAAAFGVAALYLVIRSQVAPVGPSLGEGGYNFRVGVNVPLNLVKLLGAAAEPLSTVWVVGWHERGQWAALAAAALLALAVVLVTALGWRRTGRARTGWFVLLLAVAVVSPTLLLNHVSELYVYGALPLLCVLAGVGLGAWSSRPYRIAVGLLLVLHLLSTESKLAAMRANGRRAATLLAELVPLARALPANGTLSLVQPPAPRRRYSVFVLEGWDILSHGVTGVVTLSGRPDITVRIVEAGQPPDGRAVTLRGGRAVEPTGN